MRGFVQESSIVSVIGAVAISGKGGSSSKTPVLCAASAWFVQILLGQWRLPPSTAGNTETAETAESFLYEGSARLRLNLDSQEQVAALAFLPDPPECARLIHTERHWVPAGFSTLHAQPAAIWFQLAELRLTISNVLIHTSGSRYQIGNRTNRSVLAADCLAAHKHRRCRFRLACSCGQQPDARRSDGRDLALDTREA